MVIPKSYYLAHPTWSRKEVREWELGFEERTGLILANPFYDVPNRRIKDPEEVVEGDLRLMRGQEGLLCVLDGESTIGTYQEMVYAYLDKKKIYVIASGRALRHPWILYHADRVFESRREFEDFVMGNMNQD